jgi:hypothetical protein
MSMMSLIFGPVFFVYRGQTALERSCFQLHYFFHLTRHPMHRFKIKTRKIQNPGTTRLERATATPELRKNHPFIIPLLQHYWY